MIMKLWGEPFPRQLAWGEQQKQITVGIDPATCFNLIDLLKVYVNVCI
jgi:hypothetical protein